MIHAAVGLSEKLFGVIAIVGRNGQSHAQGEDLLTANIESGLARERTNLLDSLGGIAGSQTRGNHHKFVSTHAGHVVVFAAAVFEGLGKQTQDTISLQVPEAVIDLLEAVHVAHHERQRGVVALAAGQFAVELQKQRPRVGQAGQVIGGGGAFRLLILESIFDGQSHLAAHREQNAKWSVVKASRSDR